MKKMLIGMLGAAVMLIAVPETMAGHHRHHRDKGNDGLRLAAGIINLVKAVIAPTPEVVYTTPATVVQRPVVITPPVNHRPEYRKPQPPRRYKPQPPRAKQKPQPKRGGKRR